MEEVEEVEEPPPLPLTPWQALVLDVSCAALTERLRGASEDLEDATTDPDTLVAACRRGAKTAPVAIGEWRVVRIICVVRVVE